MTQFTEAPIFDADQHMYETPEALTKYLPDRFRKAVQFVQVGRHTRIAILNKITEYIPNPTFERVAAPGAHERFYSGQNPEGLTMRQMTGTPIEAPAASRNPVDRIKELDRQGVDETLVYPTLANLVEHSAAEDPELTAAMIHALNQWMLEQWGYTYQDRLYMTPVLTLGLVDEARRELEYVLDNGAKVALIKPAPVKGYRGWRSRRCLSSIRSGATSRMPACRSWSTPASLRWRNTSASGSRLRPTAPLRCRRSSGWYSGIVRSPTCSPA
ncbi:amidohydrolase family protein [Mycobacterium xenopi 4042]|uniref:Amidohydrolase family protein n=1 Tax=Mycobacterium xenopi 4042 TaxID=1299334 RepID=X8AHS8_MYCXE|nr:amidohydrolase family protein [Mycobacterium xenopi 4042]